MVSPILTTSVSVGFDTLRANPLRTLLSTLGIVMGVAALTSVLSIGDGVERFARQQVEQRTTAQEIQLVPGGRGGGPFGRRQGGRGRGSAPTEAVQFTLAGADSLSHTLGADAAVNLVANEFSSAVTMPRDSAARRGVQITRMLFAAGSAADSLLAAGRVFTPQEGRAGAPIAVLSDQLAVLLAGTRPPGSLVGDTILIDAAPRQVVGILKPDSTQRIPRLFMPLGALPTAAGTVAGISNVTLLTIKARRVEDLPIVRQKTELWLATTYGSDWSSRITVVSQQAVFDQISQALLIFKIFMSALMSISLLVGGIGIMNVLLASVIERTREIGIRKAVGAQQRHILWQFLAESITITSVGSLIGLTLGVLGAMLITFIMRRMANAPIHAWLSISTVLTAVGASVLIGVVFGLYPAMRAARLAPIEAMHHE